MSYFLPNNRLVRLYLSGSISNDPDYYEKFERIANKIKSDNNKIIIINPAHISKLFNLIKFSWLDYMELALKIVNKSDIIYFLDDYKTSEGALIEYHTAKKMNKICLVQNEFEPPSFKPNTLNKFLYDNFNVRLNKLYFNDNLKIKQ